ncbi:MAG: endopeptidase La, partial [Actinomycetota bacterium]|nr:endopeptidase La [Actinomycetota bacterium]
GYARVGTVAAVEDAGRLPGGQRALLVRGLQRASVGAGVPGEGSALWVQVTPIADQAPSPRAHELAREYRAVIHNILELRGASRFAEILSGLTDPGAVADSAGYWPDLDLQAKVQLLETLDVEARLELALRWARETLADLQLRDKVRAQASEDMERSQREYLLRQQLAAIRKELGDADGDVVAEYRRKVAEADLPPTAREAAEREVDRLERMSEQSPEHGWVRTWLDWVTELPWGTRSDDRLDLAAAREVLDADHTGLDDVKDRILEYLAVQNLRRARAVPQDQPDRSPDAASRHGSGAILALVGPPGVGKTSLGESVARALGRRFVRVALGGVRDEAEIRGHRRTYVGAQPGRVVRALREAGTMNPVFLLDEVDKVASDWRGDPASALLEVLDPAQNHTFRDHYLEIDLDLSDVLFVATANVVETIPPALLDRLEVIRLDGYTDAEKVTIARAHLLSRQMELAGLQPGELELTDAALAAIVSGYTNEAGVRGLERQLGKLARKAALRVAAGAPGAPLVVDAEALRDLLGRPPVFREAAERTAVPGVATGLAVTGSGGDVLFIEATAMEGEPGLTLTGQLGDVMKESAEIALSYVRSHAERLGLAPGALARRRVHVHVPAGAVPKDGPSAGVTMTTALASLLSGRPVKATVGMTGEVTLQGRVLPVGGIKQKVLAAHRAGLREVILPARNADDVDDVPETVRAAMTFHFADDVGDVLSAALSAPEPVAATA